MTSAIAAYGSTLKIGDAASPEVFTAIAEVTDISGFGLMRDTEEATHHASTSRYKEFIATLKELKEFTLEVNWGPAEATHGNTSGLVKDLDDGTLRNFQLVFPDSGSTTWSFAALVTEIDIPMPVGGKLTGSITLRPSGAPTLA